ncbi:TrmH family RNA methyltransferase [Nesterenkonia populi]
MADDDVLSSPKSERVRKAASLASAKGRRRAGLFLAEGPQPVREALRAWLAAHETSGEAGSDMPAGRSGPGESPPSMWIPQLDALYFDPEALERHRDVQTLLDRVRGVLFDPQADLPQGARIFLREATPEVLTAMGDAETSQGIIAVCRIPQPQELPEGAALAAALLRVQDPGNAGTIIRAADAVGADAVLLTPGSVDPWAPKVVRSAAGSHFHLPLITGMEAGPATADAARRGMQVLAADAAGETSLDQLRGTPSEPGEGTIGGVPPLELEDTVKGSAPTMWLFGNEAQGLAAQERELADVVVSIPLYGQAESLNVATAAALCLYTTAMAQH